MKKIVVLIFVVMAALSAKAQFMWVEMWHCGIMTMQIIHLS